MDSGALVFVRLCELGDEPGAADAISPADPQLALESYSTRSNLARTTRRTLLSLSMNRAVCGYMHPG